MSVVKHNLMNQRGYSPYCGNDLHTELERTRFDGEQFRCSCGWRSQFEPEFIAEYKAMRDLLSLPRHTEDSHES